MKRRSYAKRRDANEPDIIEALRDVGASYLSLDPFDLLVGWQGRNIMVEVKTQSGRLKPSQIELAETWRGGPLHIVRTPEEMMALLNGRESGEYT